MRSLMAIMLATLAMSSHGATLIHAGKLVDVATGKVLEQQTITVEGDRVISVESGYQDGRDADIINLRVATVMPGLMDMHGQLDD